MPWTCDFLGAPSGSRQVALLYTPGPQGLGVGFRASKDPVWWGLPRTGTQLLQCCLRARTPALGPRDTVPSLRVCQPTRLDPLLQHTPQETAAPTPWASVQIAGLAQAAGCPGDLVPWEQSLCLTLLRSF